MGSESHGKWKGGVLFSKKAASVYVWNAEGGELGFLCEKISSVIYHWKKSIFGQRRPLIETRRGQTKQDTGSETWVLGIFSKEETENRGLVSRQEGKEGHTSHIEWGAQEQNLSLLGLEQRGWMKSLVKQHFKRGVQALL